MKKSVDKSENPIKQLIDAPKKILNTHPLIVTPKTLGQKAADKLALWAGSWTFIIFFFLVLIFWMAANIYAWINTWDPYPFILLNLVLSCLAAIQAPVILMSQNRQSQKDRIRAEYDYQVNRRAEKEIQEIKRVLEKIEKKIKK